MAALPAGQAVSRPPGPKPGPEVWIGWINTVGGDRPMLGARKYDSLRREQKLEKAPWARTLMRWAGMPWSQMCAAAGKSGGDAGPPRSPRGFWGRGRDRLDCPEVPAAPLASCLACVYLARPGSLSEMADSESLTYLPRRRRRLGYRNGCRGSADRMA